MNIQILEIVDKEILTLYKDDELKLKLKRNEIVDVVFIIKQQLISGVANNEFSALKVYIKNLFQTLNENEYTYCTKLHSSYKHHKFDLYNFKIKFLQLIRHIIDKPNESEKNLKNFLELIELHKNILNYFVTLASLLKDKNNIIISNRTAGWNKIGWNKFGQTFQIAEGLKVSIFKNFGYGNSSYFYMLLSYKGVSITTYTDYVKYEFAKAYEVIRYTRKYQSYTFKTNKFKNISKTISLKYSGWEDLMSYILKLTEIPDCDKELYFHNYLNEQFTIMVKELEIIFNSNNYIFYKNVENDEKEIIETSYVVGLKERLLSYRSEKIFGSLEFFSSFSSNFLIENKESINKLFNLYNQQFPFLMNEKDELIKLVPTYEKSVVEAEKNVSEYLNENRGIHILINNSKVLEEKDEKESELYQLYLEKKDYLTISELGLENLNNTIRRIHSYEQDYLELKETFS